MISFLFEHCFHAWNLQYQTDTKGSAYIYKASCPALLQSSLPIHSLSTVIFRLCTGHCKLNHHLSRLGLHLDVLCDQCDLPETVEHVIEVCPKYSAARQRLQHALNQIGINKTSSSFAASCLRKSPTWSSIPLQRFRLALII